ncbi:uncharacterized protein [Nicotiana sylvestris]|uniref:Probable basic-leucine zipper transcription factor F n=1 Tax=Nicotiana sylvestris TaxID=4096 RepID=A0A1U7W438_NICSY|nr:PREDICTED: probable basic-leucine zipper transcription factor F [Nicotiana sylvestris]
MFLSSGKVVGNVNVTTKEQWKEVKDNRVRSVVNQNTSLNNNGMEIAPNKQLKNNKNKEGTSNVDRQAEAQSNSGKELVAVDNEDNDHVQVANKFAILQGMEEEEEHVNQLAMVAANATTNSPAVHNQASTKQKPKHMVNNEGKLDPTAQSFHLNSSSICSTNGLVNGKEALKAKNYTAQWVERSFKDKIGDGIVKINTSCKEIPSQDTVVNKELNKTPNTKAEGLKSSTFKERVQGCGGRLWDAQREYDSEENEVPLGAQADEEPNEKDKEEDEQSLNEKSVNGELHANDNNTSGNLLIMGDSEIGDHNNNYQITEVTEIRNYEGRGPEVNDPGRIEDDKLQKEHNTTDKEKQPNQKTEIAHVTGTLEKKQLQLLKRVEEKALVLKRMQVELYQGRKTIKKKKNLADQDTSWVTNQLLNTL